MDGSQTSSPWNAQKVALEGVLNAVKEELVERGLPVVINCREPAATGLGPNIFESRGTVQAVLEKMLRKKHPIQLHFFTGGVQEVEAWQGWNVYFSVPVGLTHQQPAEGFKTIPRDRLLLETDAPYLPLPGNKHSTPFDVASVDPAFAKALGCTVSELLRLTGANARALFKL
jgi:TatD DNase family protein